MITLIAAVARDGAIGRNGDLLWHLPEDLRHFKALTLGAPIVMGRKTWDSLPKRPLPGRLNIVITSRPDSIQSARLPSEIYALLRPEPSSTFQGAQCPGSLDLTRPVAARDIDEALRIGSLVARLAGKDLFIIGGGSVYAQALPHADALELTEIALPCPDADTRFPSVDPAIWRPVSSVPGSHPSIPYSFVRYERACGSKPDS